MLKIQNLTISIENKTILENINLELENGEILYLEGPNAAGKSTLAKTIAGFPNIKINSGEIFYKNKDVTKLSLTERAQKEIFYAHQHPVEVPGVNLLNFLRIIYNEKLPKEDQLSVFKFKEHLKSILEKLELDMSFVQRNLNEGFSGGEKKKCEALQILLLKPDLVILDEIDSGLDRKATETVFKAIRDLKEKNLEMSLIIITHYDRAKEWLKPDRVEQLGVSV